MAEKAAAMVRLHADGKHPQAEAAFAELQTLANTECDRLADVTEECRRQYTSVQERWSFAAQIKSTDKGNLQPDGGDPDANKDAATCEDAYVDRLLMRSAWAQPTFERLMRQLESTFNASQHPLTMPGIAEHFEQSLMPHTYKLPGRPGQNCHLKCGPLKGKRRCLDKVKKYNSPAEAKTHPARPAGRYLIDTLRATFTFEDPYAMAVFFELLSRTPGIRILRVKNKLVNTELKPQEQTTILINVEIEKLDPTQKPLVAEVQLTLQDYLDIKKALHKFYQIVRASDYAAVLGPIFPVQLESAGYLTAAEEANDAKVQALRSQLNSAVSAGDYDQVAALAAQLKKRVSETRADPLATFSTAELINQQETLYRVAERHGGASEAHNNALELLDAAVEKSQKRDKARIQTAEADEYDV
jgi:hypothetical protein